MIEVLWHGRGGQGAFTAARLLGAASSLADGKFALAFPSFGPERRGAPMRAFTKMADAPIGDRSAVAQANYVVYLDDTLLGEGWENELKPDGVVLINSTRTFDDARIIALDANGISSEVLGRPIPNTVFLGALAALSDRVSVEEVQEAVRQYMPAKLHAANIKIIELAAAALGERQAAASAAPEAAPEQGSVASVAQAPAATPPAAAATSEAPRPAGSIPTLRDAESAAQEGGALDPYNYAHSTCFEAGYLVAKNAGWRNKRPVMDGAACTGCLQCYLYCPDGTIYKVDSDKAPVAIDYDFCKGCGICVTLCKFGALTMISESEVNAS